MADNGLPSRDVLEHVVDVHCHPTDEIAIRDDVMNNLHIKICAMATNSNDQQRVANLALRFPENVWLLSTVAEIDLTLYRSFPALGYFHPWFYHEISLVNPPLPKEDHYRALLLSKDSTQKRNKEFQTLLEVLPEPMALDEILASVRANLLAHPSAMLGEVGLDRSFRIAYQPYPSPSPRKLSPFSTPIGHQLAILEAQLGIAVELRRNISIHSVTAQQVTLDLLQRMKDRHGPAWRAISIDLHSCGLSLEGWKSLEKSNSNIFLSLSTAINTRSDNYVQLIQHCSEDRLLAESDYAQVGLCVSQTWSILKSISQIRGWQLETTWDTDEPAAESWGVVRRLERNWNRFVRGGHPEVEPPKSRRLRKQHENYPSDASEGE